jgi:hypothetical protein
MAANAGFATLLEWLREQAEVAERGGILPEPWEIAQRVSELCRIE